MTRTAAAPAGVTRLARTPVLLLVVLAGSLVTYKASGAIDVIDHVRSGATFPVGSAEIGLDPVSRSIRYFAVVWPALVFGILISGAVRAFVSPEWLMQLLSHSGRRAQMTGALAGSPLMLCSCCVAPIFSSVYRASSRLAPSLALMLSAPLLNPAALALTFMLFTSAVAWGRLFMALVAVFLGTALIARLVAENGGGPIRPVIAVTGAAPPRVSPSLMTFVASCVHVLARTVPLLVLGVLGGLLVADHLPVTRIAGWDARLLAVAVTAAIAVPVPLPTFFEIPLAITLIAAGAPTGLAAVVLFAGPAVNLPSLLTIAQEAGWRASVLCGLTVWLLAVAGGMLIR